MSTVTLTEKSLQDEALDISELSATEKQELIKADAASISSGTTVDGNNVIFRPATSLHIRTRGVPVLRLPLPPSELQISVQRSDGSVAYQSTRKLRSSGNCTLTDADGRQLIFTEYWCGPSRDPVLHILGPEEQRESEIKTTSKWTSRSQTFALPDGRVFQWDYKKEKGFGSKDKKGSALVMTMDGRRIALLIRNDETRTPGSSSCSAGNGGELIMGEEVGAKQAISEEVVVASCLLMLKKEIDRRRAVQAMMIAGAIS